MVEYKRWIVWSWDKINACYIVQRAALVTYSNSNLAAFLAEKNITLKSKEFPFEKVEDFLLVYLDDLVIWSSKKIKIHLLLIEFLLWCTIKLGFCICRLDYNQ